MTFGDSLTSNENLVNVIEKYNAEKMAENKLIDRKD